ncbi:MAG TPA: DsbA family protein [Dermatophilaceae bacterium]|nr:DsbA family protein [Dermatophilaceae bacterium]
MDPAPAAPHATSGRAAAGDPAGVRMTAYGDFTCPWSYLSWQRSEVLREHGLEVDWRTVEHDPWHHLAPESLVERHRTTHAALAQVQKHLLPGEHLPHPFVGIVPFTGAATAAYAEAVVAGVAPEARRILFQAFWHEGADLNNARVVRDLLAGLLRGRPSRSELVHRWGYAVDVTGGSLTSEAWRLVRDWRSEWKGFGQDVVPALSIDGGPWVHGEGVVDQLREELTARGLEAGASAA